MASSHHKNELSSRREEVSQHETNPVRGGDVVQFPWKLHTLLEQVEKSDQQDHIISWLPDGKGFRIHDRLAFAEDLMPLFFSTSKFKSFQRSLNLWGFESSSNDVGSQKKGVRFHKYFIRGEPDLCHLMKRTKVKGGQKPPVSSLKPLGSQTSPSKSHFFSTARDHTDCYLSARSDMAPPSLLGQPYYEAPASTTATTSSTRCLPIDAWNNAFLTAALLRRSLSGGAQPPPPPAAAVDGSIGDVMVPRTSITATALDSMLRLQASQLHCADRHDDLTNLLATVLAGSTNSSRRCQQPHGQCRQTRMRSTDGTTPNTTSYPIAAHLRYATTAAGEHHGQTMLAIATAAQRGLLQRTAPDATAILNLVAEQLVGNY